MENIFNIIVEGPDGVGKSTLITGLFERYNFRYMCYHRGDMSNFVFARKYDRPFYATQRHLPLLYVYLTCDKKVLEDRINKRAIEENWSEEDKLHELRKLNDVDLFEDAFNRLKSDYLIYRIDTTFLTEKEVLDTVCYVLDKRQSWLLNVEADKTLSPWNLMYDKICKELGIDFKVFKNQPYINGEPIMVESTVQNGMYETYDNKKCYDNTLYAMAYDVDENIVKSIKKTIDFNYIINSKIRRRPEVYDYYKAMIQNGCTCMVTGRDGILNRSIIDSKFMLHQPDLTGDNFVYNIAKSKATVYCCRDLAGLELQTARLYEAILADNIVFIDEKTDPEHKIGKLMHPGNAEFFYVNPDNLVEKYRRTIVDKAFVSAILKNQRLFLAKLFEEAKEFYKHD